MFYLKKNDEDDDDNETVPASRACPKGRKRTLSDDLEDEPVQKKYMYHF